MTLYCLFVKEDIMYRYDDELLHVLPINFDSQYRTDMQLMWRQLRRKFTEQTQTRRMQATK